METHRVATSQGIFLGIFCVFVAVVCSFTETVAPILICMYAYVKMFCFMLELEI